MRDYVTGKNFTELDTVKYFTVHKSIYKHMVLWLEIDSMGFYWEENYATGLG